jgi:hypothetical protein
MAGELTPAAEFFSVLSDLVVAFGAGITAFAALSALDTWRRQIHGTARFDAARRLMIAANTLALQYHSARSPLLQAAEFPEEYWATPRQERSGRQEREAYEVVLNERWRPVAAAYAQVLALLPEAQALFPAAIGDATEKLLRTVRSLHFWFGEVAELKETAHGIDSTDGPAREALLQAIRDADERAFAPPPTADSVPENSTTLEFLKVHRRLASELALYLHAR